MGYTDQTGEKDRNIPDTVLMVIGHRPNVEGLGLEHTEVKHNDHGIEVDATLQTSEDGIYAVGDIVGQLMFTHWTTYQGLAHACQLMGKSAPFPTANTNAAVIISEPDIGITRLTEQQAKLEIAVVRYNVHNVACAKVDSRDASPLIIYEMESHRVVDAHALVEGAGKIMGEAALQVKAGLPIEATPGVNYAHPSHTESLVMAVLAAMTQAATHA